MASPSGEASEAMCSSAALAASSRPADAAAAQLRRRWMRQRPRSSERSSRRSQGGVGDAVAGWSGMLEKFCSGDDVTDDDEPSSWTISLASSASSVVFLLGNQPPMMKKSLNLALLFLSLSLFRLLWIYTMGMEMVRHGTFDAAEVSLVSLTAAPRG
uniref:Uncharacterized protein n=1 Tax=Arundo donax TaxID=35708 RepID=A0A0A9GXT3_ARUDO